MTATTMTSAMIVRRIPELLPLDAACDAVRASGNGLEQIATLPIANGKSVSLVRSGRDIILLGVGDNGVTPIKTYTEEEAIANGLTVPEEATPGRDRSEPSFQGFLDSLRRMTVRS